MRLALGLIAALWSASAAAAPAIVVIGAWVANYYLAIQIVLVVGLTVYGSATQRRASRRAAEQSRNAFNAGLQDRTATVISAELPHRYIYGRARVGSGVVAIFVTGAKDEYKHLVCYHASHECDGVEAVYVAGKNIGVLDANGDVTAGPFAEIETRSAMEVHTGASFVLDHVPDNGTLTLVRTEWLNGEHGSHYQTHIAVPFTLVGSTVTPIGYSGELTANYQYQFTLSRLRVVTHLGAPGQVVDAGLHAEIPALWPVTATLDGLTYSVVRLDLRNAEFQNGLPGVEILFRGKKVYDPRSGLTVWSQNPALCIRDYLISDMCGVPAADIPDSYVITAANVCDETLGFGKRYTMNGAVTADQDQKQVLESMAQAMAGTLVSTTWEMTAGKYIAPVAAFDQTDIVGAVAITPGVSDADSINGVRGQYISAENLYVATDFAPYQNVAYVTADGGEAWADITYPWTDSKQRVWNLARIATEDQRNGFTMKAEFSLKAFARKVGERITFTGDYFGQVAKIFRITDKRHPPGGIVELTIKEDAASIWDEADATAADATPNTNLVNPFLVGKLASLTLESGTNSLLIAKDGSIISRIHVTWPAATTSAVFTSGVIEIEWYGLDSGVPRKVTVSGSDTETYLSPVEDGHYYNVRARTVNQNLNAKSDWTYAALHQVIGKTQPPPDIETFTISGSTIAWTYPAGVPDLAGFRFKFQYGNNLDWGSATLLHGGLITESPFDLITLPFGVVTIMGKAVDTSGNESLLAANILTDLGSAAIDNEAARYDFDPTFPGSYSGGSVVAGDLVATAMDSFYGTDGQSFYGADAASFYEPSAYAQMIYTSTEVPLYSAIPGSRTIIDMNTLGTDLVVEYRNAGPEPFYGADADSFYGADGDPFYDSAPGPWALWPGSVTGASDVYQFRVTIGAGPVQGTIQTMSLIVDAPTIAETVSDLVINATPTVIPYLTAFTRISSVLATLQANQSGAVTVEIDKSNPVVPKISAYDVSHTAVAGATADLTLRGY